MDAIFALLAEMKGIDTDKLSSEEMKQYRTHFVPKFQSALSFLPKLIQESIKDKEIEVNVAYAPAADYETEWMGKLQICPLHGMEAALGKHEKVMQAAALFPEYEITVYVFSEFHCQAIHHEPYIRVCLNISDDPALALLEALNVYKPVWILSYEGAGVSIENPVDIASSIRYGAAAVRLEAEKDEDDMSLIETLSIEFNVYQQSDPESAFYALQDICAIFAAITAVIENIE